MTANVSAMRTETQRKTSFCRAISAARSIAWRRAASLVILGLATSVLVAVSSAPTGAQDNQTDPVAAVVEFRGGGWGHGVGMSQFGAYGRSVAGATPEEILTAYYPGTTIGRPATTINDLRVSLGTSSEVGLDISGPTIMAIDGVAVAVVPPGSQLTAYRRLDALDRVIEVLVPGICEPGQCVGGVVELALASGHPVGLHTTGHRYDQGVLSLTPDGDLIHTIIGSLDIEQYVLGLAEMPSSWPDAALGAQAIAGRSYAHNRALTARSRGAAFDIVATTRDQVYVGIEKVAGPHGDRWRSAVARTSGRYVLDGAEPALALYSSSNGGWIESSEYVFGGARRHLQAGPDPWDAYQNPNAQWSARYTGADIGRWLRPVTGDIGALVDLEVIGPTGLSGRTDRAVVRVIGTAGSSDIDGATLRQAINAHAGSDTLRSSLFTIAVTPLPELDQAIFADSTTPAAPDQNSGFDPIALALADRPAPRPDDPTAPRGALAIVGGELGEMVTGWALDSDLVAARVAAAGLTFGEMPELRVRITLDGSPIAVVAANQPTRYGPADVGPIGFSTPIVVPPGLHAVCADTTDIEPPASVVSDAPARPVLLGCVLAETALPDSLPARPPRS